MREKSSMDEYFVYWNDVDEEDMPVEREQFPVSPEDEDDMPFSCKRNSARRNPKERIQSLQSSLKFAFDDYCKQFQDIETELVRAKQENNQLSERNNTLEEELEKAKVQLESSKRNLEQTRNKMQELCTAFTAVKEECDQICQQQDYTGAPPQPSKKRKFVLKIYEVNDCVNCPICLESWTQSGEHNVCSLSCGHFFGRSCITQWIKKGGTRGSSKCPLCSTKATGGELKAWKKIMKGGSCYI
ncbi:hypothetical protein SUGI_0541250 [Cryptomeria japonica]|nr:hypothetical protein SUGI_0541250 [Cryptomeria japonica]